MKRYRTWLQLHADYGKTQWFAALLIVFAVTTARADPNVVAWGGYNQYGERDVPADLTNAVAVAAGQYHSVALRADGTVEAWGAGRLNAGTWPHYGQAMVPAGLSNVVAIAAGAWNSVALRRDGTVVAWGGDPGAPSVTNVTAKLTNVVTVAGCAAVRADGTVITWGNDATTNVPPDLANVVSVATGGSFDLAVRADGTVAAWGDVTQGGNPDLSATRVPAGLTNAVAAATGWSYSLALRADGTVVAWGDEANGEVPPGLSNVVAVAGGEHAPCSLALRADGKIVVWGSNDPGLTQIPSLLSNVVALAAGAEHCLAVVGCGEPFVTTPLANRQIFAGGTAYFRVAASGAPSMSYRWRFNGTDLPSATNGLFILENVQPSQAGAYSVVVSNPFGTVVSSTGRLEVVPILVNAQPQSKVVALGETAIFSVEVGAAAPGYQWRFNGMDLLGATNAALTLTNVRRRDAGAYSVVVSNAWGTLTSREADLHVINVKGWNIRTGDGIWVPEDLTNIVQVASAWCWFCGIEYLALRDDGTVVEWNERVGIRTYLQPPSGLTNVVAVAAMGHNFAALRADSTVASCYWSFTGCGSLAVAPGLTNIVVLGPYGMLLRADGRVVRWGEGPTGLTNVVALGGGAALRADGTVVTWDDGATTHILPGLSNVVAVAGGENRGVALRADGTVVAWGLIMPPPGLTNVVAVMDGQDHQLAVRSDGTVVAWGLEGATNVPPGLTNVVAVSGGMGHNLAVLGDGEAPFLTTPLVDRAVNIGGTVYFRAAATRVWPVNYQWQFNGTDLPGATNAVLALSNVQLEQAGQYSVIVRNSLGAVTCAHAQLAVVPFLFYAQPLSQVMFLGGTVTLTVELGATAPSYQWRFNGADLPGATNSTLTLSDVRLDQAGAYAVAINNAFGSGTSREAELHVNVVAAWGGGYIQDEPADLTNVLAVAGGGYHSLALRADGTVAAWGENGTGQTDVPSTLTNVAAVACGWFHSLALQADGTVVAWGANHHGQANAPAGLTNVVAVAGGETHSLALQADGTVIAWGTNDYGQTTVPLALTNAVAVAAGCSHSLALRADGTVVAWGNNSSGQCGVPAGLTNAVAVAGGYQHSLALRADGTVVAWGRNDAGQCNVPAGLSNVVAVAGCGFHSLALRANGTVVAWGYNQAEVPSALTNVLAVAGGDFFSMALVGDSPPLITTSLSSPALTTEGFSVSIPTQSGGVYALEYKNSLADALWTPLPLVAGTGHERTLTDPTVKRAQRFYRVRRW